MKEHTATIKIPREILDEMNEILALDHEYEDAGHTEVIETYTVRFDDGCEADIKVCNGDEGGPFVDPVLFDENGCEIMCIEVADQLDGEYIFRRPDPNKWDKDSDQYTVIVEAE